MLADTVDAVIGVDTHRDTHTAQIIAAKTGALGPDVTYGADGLGYRRMLAFADKHACEGERLWAIESTGSFGAGLTTYLRERGERVAEIDRPKRPARRNGAKSDRLDALRAAREALERPHLAEPRMRGQREAIRVALRTREGAVRARTVAICHLKALIVTAPEGLRGNLRRERDLLGRCSRLRTGPAQSLEHRATVCALRCTARRALALEAEASELESELEQARDGDLPGSARRARRRNDLGCGGDQRLVTSGADPLGVGLRDDRRGGADPGILGADGAPPAQSWWRPPAQPRPARDRALAAAARP